MLVYIYDTQDEEEFDDTENEGLEDSYSYEYSYEEETDDYSVDDDTICF